MSRLSIFTPTHDPRFLADLYASIKDQPFDEWLVLHNNGSRPVGFKDPRVKEVTAENTPPLVGALKAEACRRATGDILVEVDHDDLLAPTAIEKVRDALSGPAGFCYSNTVETDNDFKPRARYSEKYGWRYRPIEYAGHPLNELVAFPPMPDSISRIWFAPNHVRAFRRDVYTAVGGYDESLRVLDDLDLMCRLYQLTPFQHIDAPLYVYRVHGKNTWLQNNDEIQTGVWKIHDRYAEALVSAWSQRSALRRLDLGGRFAKKEGFESVDLLDADVCCDLDERWPFADSSVGMIRAYDIFEHLRDPLHTMREVYRVLAPGGWLFAQVPSTDGRGAFQDPTHRSYWNENSWLYYTHRNWSRYIDSPVRFQAVRSYTTAKDAREVCWTVAHLVSLKDGYRPPGLIDI